jgi:hypothetical protein
MIPVVKEALVELTQGQRALKIWVFVADITEEFILGPDILWAYHATVDVERHGSRLGQDELPVKEAPTASVLAMQWHQYLRKDLEGEIKGLRIPTAELEAALE